MSDAEKKLADLTLEVLTLTNIQEAVFDPSAKKKKKKKTVEFAALDVPADDDDNAEEDPSALFADLKKHKKKKKPAPDFDQEDNESKPNDDTEEKGDEEYDFGKKKRPKKKPQPADENGVKEENQEEKMSDEEDENAEDDDGRDPWLGSDRDYSYQELLTRVFKILLQNNPELSGEKRRYTIVPPSLHRDGSKKTVFANIAEISRRMNRAPDHVVSFLFTELGTTGSIDGEQRLVIKGRFQQKQIENVLRRYIGSC